MNSGADAFAFQKFRQRIAPLGADDIHVINMSGPRSFRRDLHDAFQPVVVARGNISPVLVQLVDVTQLDPADRRLKFVETKIVTNEVVNVF